MDIISIVNAMQPRTISRLALHATDFPNGESGIPFMSAFVQLFPNATLPDPVAVTAYEPTYNATIAALQSSHKANIDLPDLATQVANLTAALVSSGTIKANDLPIETLAAVNNKLAAIGAAEIS